MITLSHKSKQYLLATLKLFIVGITFTYIYLKLLHSSTIDFKDFMDRIWAKNTSVTLILLFFLLTASNWFFEILKWKTLCALVEAISFKTALKQSLAALTVSLVTPNRIGDYGAKAMFFIPEKRRQILLLNFFSNVAQMLVTCSFGFIGLVYVIETYSLSFSTTKVLIFIVTIILLGILGYIFKEKELILKGLSVSRVSNYFKSISRQIKLKVLLYSLARYISFSLLFFAMLNFFGGEISFSEAMPLIFTMYLLVSLLPSIFIFDVVIRGGVAVWLFSLAGVSELPVLCTVLGMWLLNFVFPAIWGSFYVVSYKLPVK
jgi:hypothetical protein